MASSTKMMSIPTSAFTLLRYMNKTRPSDISPRLEDLVNDNSLDDTEGPNSLTSFGSSTYDDEIDQQNISTEDDTNRNFSRSDSQLDNKSSKRGSHSHSEPSSDKEGSSYTKLSRNKDGYPFLPLNPSQNYDSNSSTESFNGTHRGYRKQVDTKVRYPTPEPPGGNNEDFGPHNMVNKDGVYPSQNLASTDDMETTITKPPSSLSRGSAETPIPSSPFMSSDDANFININIPEKPGDPSIREVLVEVAKLKQAKLLSSVASAFYKGLPQSPSGPSSLENTLPDHAASTFYKGIPQSPSGPSSLENTVPDHAASTFYKGIPQSSSGPSSLENTAPDHAAETVPVAATASEAPDVVVSTTRRRDRRFASEGGDNDQESVGNDVVVATLARLCQLYANLVQILKEENAELVATSSSSSSGSSSGGSPGYTLFIHNQPAVDMSPSSTPRHRPSYKGNQKQSHYMNNPSLESRSLSNSFNGQPLDVPSPRRTKTNLRLPQSPKTIRVHRSPNRGRENSRTRDSVRDSPAKKGNYHEFMPGSPKLKEEAFFKEHRSRSLQPLRIHNGRKYNRHSSGKENQEEDDSLSESTQIAKIQELEEGIKEILHLEPIDLIFKENNSNVNRNHKYDSEPSPLRRTKSLNQKEQKRDFYRHKVKKSPRSQDVVDSDDERSVRGGSPCGTNGDCCGGYCNYKMLAQSAHVEVDKLRQLVQLLNNRLTELSRRTVESEARLREEMQKAAIMERFLERNALQNSSGNDSTFRGTGSMDGRRYTHSLLAWGDPNSSTEATLRNKLDMAREEIELLRQHIDLLLRMRQEDLKVYESTVDKFRQTLTTGNQW